VKIKACVGTIIAALLLSSGNVSASYASPVRIPAEFAANLSIHGRGYDPRTNGGHAISGGGAVFDSSISATIAPPGSPISWNGTLTYQPPTAYNFGSFASCSACTTQTSYLPTGTYMQSAGDHFDNHFDVTHVTGYASGNVKFLHGFVYNIYDVSPIVNGNGNPQPYGNPQTSDAIGLTLYVN